MWIPFPWEFLLPCTALVHTHTHVHVRPVASGFWGSQLHPIPKSNPDVVTSTHYDPIDKLWLATDSHVMNSFLSSHASRPSNQMQSMTLSVQITPIHLPFYSQFSVTFRQRLLSFFRTVLHSAPVLLVQEFRQFMFRVKRLDQRVWHTESLATMKWQVTFRCKTATQHFVNFDSLIVL